MAVKVGHARISETGKIYGKKGDQTGNEVAVTNWVNPGWKFVAIHPDAAVRERHAQNVEKCCSNNNVGYSQYERNTLWTEFQKTGDLSKVAPCNTDCSEMQNTCAVAAGTPKVTHASNGWTTSTMKTALTNAGYKILTSYLTEPYAVRGAIYVKPGEHTVCALSNGDKYIETLKAAGVYKEEKQSQTGGALNKSPRWVGKVIKQLVYVKSWAGSSFSNIKSWPKLGYGNMVDVCDSIKAADGSTWYYIRIAGKYFGFIPSNTLQRVWG